MGNSEMSQKSPLTREIKSLVEDVKYLNNYKTKFKK